MGFTPLYDRVVIKRDDKILITPAGLLRSEVHTQMSDKATVRYVGCGKIVDGAMQAPQVQPGDRVMVAQGAGVDIEIDGEKLTMILEANILGVLTVK